MEADDARGDEEQEHKDLDKSKTEVHKLKKIIEEWKLKTS